MMRVRAIDVIQALQDFVALHGEDTRVAVAVNLSRPYRLEIVGLAVDSDIRRPDEPALPGPPLVWLTTDAPDEDTSPYAPRRACVPRVLPG